MTADGFDRAEGEHEYDAQAAEMVATTSLASARARACGSGAFNLPPELTEAVRLQSLERFARRKDTQERTGSPQGRTQVRDLRKYSVCGTGVAERKVLGSASKLKIDTLIADGTQHPDAFGRPHGPPGLRRCADSINGVHHKSGTFENSGARGDFVANDHSSIARLGVRAEGLPADHPRKALVAELAPPAPPLPVDEGWTLAGKDRPSMRGMESPREMEIFPEEASPGTETVPALPSASVPAASPRSRPRDSAKARTRLEDTAAGLEGLLRRQDTAFHHESTFGEQMTGVPGDDTPGKTWDGDRDGDGDGSVSETLRAAGDAVRALSLEERRVLFEVVVHEHVSALTKQLFNPEDGVRPRVNIDVAM